MSGPNRLETRASEIFRANEGRVHRRTDRLILRLLFLEWAACVALAVFVTPLTWAGRQASLHPHLALAIGMGGLLTVLPWYLVRTQPGQPLTRHVVAVAQTGFSAILIHLTGGRLETHFHIFGSLAFLAYYRDPRVLVTASLVLTADHALRGLYFPQSIFGVLLASPWRFLEHVGWVVFEDVFLVIAIGRSLTEMRTLAHQKAELEAHSADLEREVARRTAELETALEQARAADQAKSRFMANVTHELRTPLNAIIGFADVLQREAPANEAEAVDNIAEAGHLLLDLVQDVLDASAEDVGTAAPAPTIFDPVVTLRHVVAVARASRPDAAPSTTIAPDSALPPRLSGPSVPIARVVLALVNNAIDHGGGSAVEVRVRCEDGALCILVRDAGPGIPDAMREAIFEPFTVADERARRGGAGAGQGLYLARRRAERIGGQLRLVETSDAGSVFELRVPVTPAEPDAVTTDLPEAVDDTPDLSGARVLVAEDNRLNQLLVKRVLERVGCVPTLVDDGQAAVDAIRDDPDFDCILMDLRMPVLDGLQASLHIRDELGWTRPIHALTANNTPADRQACLDAKMTSFMSKPIVPEALYAVILRSLDHGASDASKVAG